MVKYTVFHGAVRRQWHPDRVDKEKRDVAERGSKRNVIDFVVAGKEMVRLDITSASVYGCDVSSTSPAPVPSSPPLPGQPGKPSLLSHGCQYSTSVCPCGMKTTCRCDS